MARALDGRRWAASPYCWAGGSSASAVSAAWSIAVMLPCSTEYHSPTDGSAAASIAIKLPCSTEYQVRADELSDAWSIAVMLPRCTKYGTGVGPRCPR